MTVPDELMEEIRTVLYRYWFSEDGEDNNEDVIAVSKKVDLLIKGGEKE